MKKEVIPNKKISLWEFPQNNSGGRFHVNESVSIYVYVDAESAEEANSYAEDYTDIYFDGCRKEIDCPCCGDRWRACHGSSPAFESIEELEEYYQKPSGWRTDQTIFEYTADWVEDGAPVIIVYLRNGDKIIYRK